MNGYHYVAHVILRVVHSRHSARNAVESQNPGGLL